DLHFLGKYEVANFKLSSDGSGGTTVIDPPAPVSSLKVDPIHNSSPVGGNDGLSHGQQGLSDAVANLHLHDEKFDLSTLDANVNAPGTQHVTSVTNTQTAQPNYINWFHDHVHDQTVAQAEVTGDTTHDHDVHLAGKLNLHLSDFITS